jgi:hypothetical protein
VGAIKQAADTGGGGLIVPGTINDGPKITMLAGAVNYTWYK